MKQVLDAHALLSYLEKEKGYEIVVAELAQAARQRENMLMTAVNFGEVYYIVLREYGEFKAVEIETLIRTLPLDIISVDSELAKEAARFKASRKMSYADCFAAALTKMNGGRLITGDNEFRNVEGEIKILWLS